ncbi:MAG: hypothetical protein ABL989_07710 [Gammaproteobacteria bacterium]
MTIRRRGRPHNSTKFRIAQSDAAIAETCVTLARWGLPIGDEVGRAVAEAAAKHLGRTDADGLPLGWHSIEKIYKTHIQTSRARGDFVFRPGRYRKWSLRQQCPDKTLSVRQWADLLIPLGGIYQSLKPINADELERRQAVARYRALRGKAALFDPYVYPMMRGDLVLTPKVAASLTNAPRITTRAESAPEPWLPPADTLFRPLRAGMLSNLRLHQAIRHYHFLLRLSAYKRNKTPD